jgi:hypothetical protein
MARPWPAGTRESAPGRGDDQREHWRWPRTPRATIFTSTPAQPRPQNLSHLTWVTKTSRNATPSVFQSEMNRKITAEWPINWINQVDPSPWRQPSAGGPTLMADDRPAEHVRADQPALRLRHAQGCSGSQAVNTNARYRWPFARPPASAAVGEGQQGTALRPGRYARLRALGPVSKHRANIRQLTGCIATGNPIALCHSQPLAQLRDCHWADPDGRPQWPAEDFTRDCADRRRRGITSALRQATPKNRRHKVLKVTFSGVIATAYS